MSLLKQTVEDVDLATLQPHPENPRIGDTPAIGASMEKNGNYNLIVAQRSTRRILAGAHRWQALLAAGVAAAPVAWVDVDDATAREILLGDNRTHDLGGYNTESLVDLLHDLDSYEGTGYDDYDVASLLRSLDSPAASVTPSQPDVAPSDAPPVASADSAAGFMLPPVQAQRIVILPFPIAQYEDVTSRLPGLRDDWEVDTNAELFLAMLRYYAEEAGLA